MILQVESTRRLHYPQVENVLAFKRNNHLYMGYSPALSMFEDRGFRSEVLCEHS